MINKEFLNAINSAESNVTPSMVIMRMLENCDEYEEIADMLDLYVDSDKRLSGLETALDELLYEMENEPREA